MRAKTWARHGNRTRERPLFRDLILRRELYGISREELIIKMGCTEADLARMEGTPDAEVTLGDLVRYLGAVGGNIQVEITSVGVKVLERIW
jgi:hypothetical protein